MALAITQSTVISIYYVVLVVSDNLDDKKIVFSHCFLLGSF